LLIREGGLLYSPHGSYERRGITIYERKKKINLTRAKRLHLLGGKRGRTQYDRIENESLGEKERKEREKREKRGKIDMTDDLDYQTA
jgi:hypothetical protein